MTPAWLDQVAMVHLVLSALAGLVVAADIFVLGHRQKMTVMEIVWPITVLYFGPIGLIFYFWISRTPPPERSMWQYCFGGSSHCGAGCMVGDVIGDWLVYAAAFTLFGSELLGRYLVTFVLAFLFGIGFQYFSIAPMRGLGLREGLVEAVKVDALSITAYQVGMFGVMAVVSLALFPDLHTTDPAYWFLMQIAMVVGFATTFPVNWWLIRRRTKEKM